MNSLLYSETRIQSSLTIKINDYKYYRTHEVLSYELYINRRRKRMERKNN
jgi:hypothetical protein